MKDIFLLIKKKNLDAICSPQIKYMAFYIAFLLVYVQCVSCMIGKTRSYCRTPVRVGPLTTKVAI